VDIPISSFFINWMLKAWAPAIATGGVLIPLAIFAFEKQRAVPQPATTTLPAETFSLQETREWNEKRKEQIKREKET
jgi:hypothetical protein